MKDTKLLAAFKTLDSKQLKKFIKFIESPYYNEHAGLVRLGHYLFQLSPDFLEDDLDRRKVFAHVYPDEEYNDLRFRHLSSDFLKLLEKFFATEELKASAYDLDINSLRAARKKGLEKHFNSIYRKLLKRFQNDNVVDGDFYFKTHLIESEYNDFLSDRYVRKGENNFENTVDSLDTYFILTKLKFGCYRLDFQKVFDREYNIFLLDDILNHVQKKDYSDKPLIAAYFHIYNMLDGQEAEENYANVKAILDEHLDHFGHRDQKDILHFAMNFCIRRLNKGGAKYYRESFSLYKMGLEKEVLLENGQLSPWTFKNVVVNGCYLDEFSWVEGFISKYHDLIPEEHRDNSYTFNLALVHWFKKDYKKVLRLISRVEFDDPFYALDAKTILLKIYFEQREYDSLLSLCESFRIYLKRNRLVSETHKKYRLDLIRYAARLIKVKPYQKDRLGKIKQEIVQQPDINNRKWLLDQIEVMETEFADY